MTHPARAIGDSSLIDLLDRLIETGVAATGDVLLGLADVDLIRVNLQLVLGAVDTLAADDNAAPVTRSDAAYAKQADTAPVVQTDAPGTPTVGHSGFHAERPAVAAGEQPIASPGTTATPVLDALTARQPDRPDLGVGALLVAVIEIVHRLLERQAIHRMEHGSLTNDQVERLGQALMLLDQRINQLIEIFGLRSTSALPATVAGAH